jgi:hypothetical protein
MTVHPSSVASEFRIRPSQAGRPVRRYLTSLLLVLTTCVGVANATAQSPVQEPGTEVYRIEDGGQARSFVIAPDEIAVTRPA